MNVSLTISAAHSISGRSKRRRKLADDLLEQLTVWTPRERMGMFRAWSRDTLSLIHLNVLTLIEVDGPMSMGRLATALDVSVASATGIVSRMTARGVVERRRDVDDRRVVLVHPTAAGTRIFQSLEDHRRGRLAELLEQLSEDEMAGFLLGLRALHAARTQVAASAAKGPAGGDR